MRLFTIAQYEQLFRNGTEPYQGDDHIPVVKLTMPDCTWLITEIDSENPNIGYGLYMPNDHFSRFDHLDLEEAMNAKNCTFLTVQYFRGKYPVSVYKDAEWWYGHLVEEETLLEKFVKKPVKETQLNLF